VDVREPGRRRYTRRTVKSTVEPLEGNKVKLSVEVDEAEFDKAIDAAFKKIAREVRIDGFRPGKAPRRVLEARLGKGIGRSQAIEDALPTYYMDAVREHDVDVIAAPEIDITSGQEEGAVLFDAVVQVRPEVVVAGYQNLRVTVDAPTPTDDEISEQLDALRSRFAELESADRPAIDGDVVIIDIVGSQAGEELAGLTTDDYSYEIGSNTIVPEVDENLRGAKVGDILEFEVTPPGAAEGDDTPEPINFRILVKDVQAKVLPDLDDEFADEASEFETLDELRDDLFSRLESTKKLRGAMALREKLGEAVADLVEEDIPEPLIEGEMRQRLQDLALRLGAQGIELEQWMQMSGQSQEDLLAELRGPAEVAARVDLALRAIAQAQGIECDDDEMEEEYRNVAQRIGAKPAEVRKRFERAGEVQAVRSDLKKRKAFEWLLERVEIVDPEGAPLDRSVFELSDDGDDDDGQGQPDHGEDDEFDDENDEESA